MVPVWEASPKQEYGARTIRSKINKVIDGYLEQFPFVEKHEFKTEKTPEKVFNRLTHLGNGWILT